MEDRINELEHRVDDLAMDLGGLVARFDEDGEQLPTQKDINELDNSSILDLQERVAAIERALVTLTNTLHVVDAASLLAVYSLIKTDSLRQPDFKSKQDVIDSGCSDAITRMLKTVQVYMNNEKEKSDGKDKAEGR